MQIDSSLSIEETSDVGTSQHQIGTCQFISGKTRDQASVFRRKELPLSTSRQKGSMPSASEMISSAAGSDVIFTSTAPDNSIVLKRTCEALPRVKAQNSSF